MSASNRKNPSLVTPGVDATAKMLLAATANRDIRAVVKWLRREPVADRARADIVRAAAQLGMTQIPVEVLRASGFSVAGDGAK